MCTAQIVQLYKDAKLSANLPYKVEFAIRKEEGTKPVKLIAHLVRGLQSISLAPCPSPVCCSPLCT